MVGARPRCRTEQALRHPPRPPRPPAPRSTLRRPPSSRLPADAVERFFVELEAAVKHRSVDAATFARMTVEQAGADAVRDMLTKFRAQDVVQAVAEMPHGHASPIVTRDGRRYVSQVFAEAQRLTST